MTTACSLLRAACSPMPDSPKNSSGYRLETAIDLGKRLIVVHGDCPTGGDRVADAWAQSRKARGMPVDYERHPAKGHPTEDFGDWPRCGPERNRYMVKLGADECLAVIGPCTSWNCRRNDIHGSHGATGCAKEAENAGIRTFRWDMWK